MRKIERFIGLVENISSRVGRVSGFLIVPLFTIVGFEVVARYVFNNPTIWAHETATMTFGAYIMLGGAYTLMQGAHVNMDVIYRHLSVKQKAIMDIITFPLFACFCGVLLWKGGETAWESLEVLERASTVWRPPIYPFKMLLPLGAFLLLLQGLAKFIRDLITLIER